MCNEHHLTLLLLDYLHTKTSLLARFMGPTWGPPGTDRTQSGPMLVAWTLLSGVFFYHWFYNSGYIQRPFKTVGNIYAILIAYLNFITQSPPIRSAASLSQYRVIIIAFLHVIIVLCGVYFMLFVSNCSSCSYYYLLTVYPTLNEYYVIFILSCLTEGLMKIPFHPDENTFLSPVVNYVEYMFGILSMFIYVYIYIYIDIYI